MTRAGLTDIVEQHAEETAFLWILRNEATREPNRDLDSLGELDERIDAHLDGLRVAGRHGWDACREQLAWREAGEIFAAASVALQSRIGRRFDAVLDVAAGSAELAGGVVGALAWSPYRDIEQTLNALIESAEGCLRAIGLAAAAAHRRDPGPFLAAALLDRDASIRIRALRMAAQLGRRDLLSLFPRSDAMAPIEERFWSAWATMLLGDRQAADALRNIALSHTMFAEVACDLAARSIMDDETTARQLQPALLPGASRLATVAAGALGDPAHVPWLIELMRDEPLARIAGEAFTTITGVDLMRAKLSVMRPDGFESGPNDDPDDDNVGIDPDEHLPWPRPNAVAHWWSENVSRFVAGQRYLLGRPISLDVLRAVLRHGRQRQRRAAALELTLLQPGEPLFEIRARADRQMEALGTPVLQLQIETS
jgi:uncharacterized protein (TIGR02270 family)